VSSSIKNLSFAQHYSSISKSCFLNIRDLRLRNTIDQTTACTIATSLIYSKIDYCNSLLLNLYLPHNRIVFNLSLTLLLDRAVTKTPKFHHITSIRKSLHWLKINERIKYKVLSLSLTYLSKLVNLLTSALLFHSHHIVVLGLPL